MTYPNAPVTPTLDEFGYPVLPAPWERVDHYTPRVQGVTPQSNRSVKLNYVSYARTDLNYVRNWKDLGEYSKALWVKWFDEMQSDLRFLHWVGEGFPAATPGFQPQGLYSVNFTHVFPVYGWVSGLVLVLSTAPPPGYVDPRALYTQLSFTPAYEGGPTWSSTTVGLKPWMEVRIDPSGVNRALIRKITSVSPNLITCELTNMLPTANGVGFTLVDDIGDPEHWLKCNPSRLAYSVPVSTAWLSIADLDPSKTIELFGRDGGSCDFAFPLPYAENYTGTFRVWAKLTPSSVAVDVTAAFLSSFPSPTAKLWNTWAPSQGFRSYFKFDITSPPYLWFKVEYRAVVDDPNAWVGIAHSTSLLSCNHNRLDGSGSITKFTELVWAKTDGNGESWYCEIAQGLNSQEREQYHALCNNTRCRYYSPVSLTGGTRISLDGIKNLLMGKNLVFRQVMAGNPTVIMLRGAGGVPSLTWLAGQPSYSQNVYSPRYTRLGHGIFGYLDTTTEPYWTIKNGTIAPGKTGVLQQGSTQPQSGTSGEVFDDGSDYAEIFSYFPGFREHPFTPPHPESPIFGYTEKYVQRIKKRKFPIRNINLTPSLYNQVQTISGCEVIHQKSDLIDIVSIRTPRAVSLGAFNGIQEQAKYAWRMYRIPMVGGNILKVAFTPGIEACEFYLGQDETGYSLYLAGGHTVDPVDERKSRNGLTSNEGSFFGQCYKARKGCTASISTAPYPLNQIRVPVLKAKAYSGEIYSGPPLGGSGVETKEMDCPGGWYPSSGKSSFLVEAVNYNYSPAWLLGIEQVAADATEFNESADAHWRIGSGQGATSGPLIPNNPKMAAAWAQYAISGNLADLGWKVRFKFTGEASQEEDANIYMVSQGYAGGAFPSVPCIPLRGLPDVEQPITFEVYNYATKGWSTLALIYDGIRDGAAPEMMLAAPGKFHLFQKNASWFLTPSNTTWFRRIRYTLTYTGAELVDILTPPKGLGHPADFEDYRRKCDEVWFELAGALATQLGNYLLGLSSAQRAQQRFEFYMDGVLPPKYEAKVDDSFGESTTMVEVRHLVRSGPVAIDSDSVAVLLSIDRPSGRASISSVSWDPTKFHDIQVKGDFLDMMPNPPAEHVTRLREGIRKLIAFTPTNLGGGLQIAFGQYHSAIGWTTTGVSTPDYGTAKNFSWGSLSALPLYVPPPPPDYTPTQVGWCAPSFLPPGGLEVGANVWSVPYLVRAIGGAGAPRFQIRIPLRADAIKACYVGIRFGGPIYYIEHHFEIVDYNPIVSDITVLNPLSAGLGIHMARLVLDETGLATLSSILGFGSLASMKMIEDSYYGMFNITDIAKYLAENPLSSTDYLCLVPSGPFEVGGTTDLHNFLSTWVSGCSGVTDEDGLVKTFSYTGRKISAGGITIGTVFVEIDHNYLSNSKPAMVAGLWPALKNS
jgi:hypothetical protein